MYMHLVLLAAVFALNSVPLNSVPLVPSQVSPPYKVPKAWTRTSPKVAPKTASKVSTKIASTVGSKTLRPITLHFRQTGGLDKICRGVMLHSDVLPHDQDQELLRLVDQSGIMDIYSLRHVNPRSVDAFHYNIAIVEDGVVTHDATFDDLTIPPSYKPLLAFLTQHSRPVGRLF